MRCYKEFKTDTVVTLINIYHNAACQLKLTFRIPFFVLFYIVFCFETIFLFSLENLLFIQIHLNSLIVS